MVESTSKTTNDNKKSPDCAAKHDSKPSNGVTSETEPTEVARSNSVPSALRKPGAALRSISFAELRTVRNPLASSELPDPPAVCMEDSIGNLPQEKVQQPLLQRESSSAEKSSADEDQDQDQDKDQDRTFDITYLSTCSDIVGLSEVDDASSAEPDDHSIGQQGLDISPSKEERGRPGKAREAAERRDLPASSSGTQGDKMDMLIEKLDALVEQNRELAARCDGLMSESEDGEKKRQPKYSLRRSLSLAAPSQGEGPANKHVYMYTRIIYVGNLRMSDQMFHSRFDLHVMWRPRDVHTDFDPIIRFPESQTYTEVMRIVLNRDEEQLGLVGYRVTMEGWFRTVLDLHMFPFDKQDLRIDMMLGRCRATGKPLTIDDGWTLKHHPTRPNLITSQADTCYEWHPVRFSLAKTGGLEEFTSSSKYTIHVPIVRNPQYYLRNHFFHVFLIIALTSFVPYGIKLESFQDRVMANLTLYLLLVAYKFSVSADLPVLSYETMFDRYMLFTFAYIFLTLVGDYWVYKVLGGDLDDPLEAQHDESVQGHYFRLQLGLIFVALIFHVEILAEIIWAKRQWRNTKKGQVDQNLRRLLEHHGVHIDDDGHVTNQTVYRQLFTSGSLLEDIFLANQKSTSQRIQRIGKSVFRGVSNAATSVSGEISAWSRRRSSMSSARSEPPDIADLADHEQLTDERHVGASAPASTSNREHPALTI